MKNMTAYLVGRRKVELREEDIQAPGPGEVQVRCLANGICAGDIFRFEEDATPQPIGHEGIGVVVEKGSGVNSVRVGDYVQCWSWTKYANMDAEKLVVFKKAPADPLEYLVEPPSCVVSAYHEYGIEPGDRVLVIGAGYMGLLNVQLLARSPLSSLVVVDVKERNLELARAYGATEVLSPKTAEGAEKLKAYEREPFDLVVECAGGDAALKMASPLVKTGGNLAIFSWHHEPRSIDLSLWHLRGLRVANASPMIATRRNIAAFARTARLLEAGIFKQRDLITHRFNFEDAEEALAFAAKREPSFIKGAIVFPD